MCEKGDGFYVNGVGEVDEKWTNCGEVRSVTLNS